MPRALHLGPRDRRLQLLELADGFVVLGDDRPSALLHLVEALQLVDPDSGLDVGHVVFEAGKDDVVTPRALGRVALERVTAHAVQAPHARLVEKLRRAGQHPALAGGQVLGRVERERDQVGDVHAVGGRADHPAAVARGQRVRRVLDDGETMPTRDLIDGVHLAGVAVEVDGHDRFDSARLADRCLDLVRVDVERVPLDVDEDGACALVLDHVNRRDEGHVRADDCVALTDAQRGQRDVQGGGGGVDRQRGRRADVGAKVVLETLRPLAGRDPAAAQSLDDLLDLLVAYQRRREMQELGAHQRGLRSRPMRWLRSGGSAASTG